MREPSLPGDFQLSISANNYNITHCNRVVKGCSGLTPWRTFRRTLPESVVLPDLPHVVVDDDQL